MTKTGFVLRNLFRKKTRFTLTLLSVVTAFVLFGLLQAINLLFNAGADFIGATRLITQARVSFTQGLPLRMAPEIEAVPGVEALATIRRPANVRAEALHPDEFVKLAEVLPR